MSIPESNGIPKLTARDGCGPGIKTNGGEKQICLTLSRLKFLYEIILNEQ